MATYKKLKSILYCGMLFLCNSLCAYGLPETLTDSDEIKYHVELLKEGEKGCLVELIPVDESSFVWTGFLFKHQSLKKKYSELFYAYAPKDIFYFNRIQRKKRSKECIYTPIQQINTIYENDINVITPVVISD